MQSLRDHFLSLLGGPIDPNSLKEWERHWMIHSRYSEMIISVDSYFKETSENVPQSPESIAATRSLGLSHPSALRHCVDELKLSLLSDEIVTTDQIVTYYHAERRAALELAADFVRCMASSDTELSQLVSHIVIKSLRNQFLVSSGDNVEDQTRTLFLAWFGLCLDQWKSLCHMTYISGDDELKKTLSEQCIAEQILLLDLAFVIVYNVVIYLSPEHQIDVVERLLDLQMGFMQVSVDIDAEAIAPVYHSALMLLLLIVGLDRVLEEPISLNSISGDSSPFVPRHLILDQECLIRMDGLLSQISDQQTYYSILLLMWSALIARLDTLLDLNGATDSASQFGAVPLVHQVLYSDESPRSQLLVSAAFNAGAFDHLHNIVNSVKQNPNSLGHKQVIKNLIDLFILCFPLYPATYPILAQCYKNIMTKEFSDVFWNMTGTSETIVLLDYCQQWFPFDFKSLILLLTALAQGVRGTQNVFTYLESLPSLTLITPSRNVVTLVESPSSIVLLESWTSATCFVNLPANVRGSILHDSLISWSIETSGWIVIVNMLDIYATSLSSRTAKSNDSFDLDNVFQSNALSECVLSANEVACALNLIKTLLSFDSTIVNRLEAHLKLECSSHSSLSTIIFGVYKQSVQNSDISVSSYCLQILELLFVSDRDVRCLFDSINFDALVDLASMHQNYVAVLSYTDFLSRLCKGEKDREKHYATVAQIYLVCRSWCFENQEDFFLLNTKLLELLKCGFDLNLPWKNIVEVTIHICASKSFSSGHLFAFNAGLNLLSVILTSDLTSLEKLKHFVPLCVSYASERGHDSQVSLYNFLTRICSNTPFSFAGILGKDTKEFICRSVLLLRTSKSSISYAIMEFILATFTYQFALAENFDTDLLLKVLLNHCLSTNSSFYQILLSVWRRGRPKDLSSNFWSTISEPFLGENGINSHVAFCCFLELLTMEISYGFGLPSSLVKFSGTNSIYYQWLIRSSTPEEFGHLQLFFESLLIVIPHDWDELWSVDCVKAIVKLEKRLPKMDRIFARFLSSVKTKDDFKIIVDDLVCCIDVTKDICDLAVTLKCVIWTLNTLSERNFSRLLMSTIQSLTTSLSNVLEQREIDWPTKRLVAHALRLCAEHCGPLNISADGLVTQLHAAIQIKESEPFCLALLELLTLMVANDAVTGELLLSAGLFGELSLPTMDESFWPMVLTLASVTIATLSHLEGTTSYGCQFVVSHESRIRLVLVNNCAELEKEKLFELTITLALLSYLLPSLRENSQDNGIVELCHSACPDILHSTLDSADPWSLAAVTLFLQRRLLGNIRYDDILYSSQVSMQISQLCASLVRWCDRSLSVVKLQDSSMLSIAIVVLEQSLSLLSAIVGVIVGECDLRFATSQKCGNLIADLETYRGELFGYIQAVRDLTKKKSVEYDRLASFIKVLEAADRC